MKQIAFSMFVLAWILSFVESSLQLQIGFIAIGLMWLTMSEK